MEIVTREQQVLNMDIHVNANANSNNILNVHKDQKTVQVLYTVRLMIDAETIL